MWPVLHQTYYNWAGAFKQVELERNILNNIALLRKQVISKHKRRVASTNDVDRIRLQELTQRGVLLAAEKNYRNESYHIAQLINDSTYIAPLYDLK